MRVVVVLSSDSGEIIDELLASSYVGRSPEKGI